MRSIDSNMEIAATRLLLRPVSVKYKDDIFREFTPAVTKYMPFTPNGDITVTEDFIKSAAKELINKTNLQLCILLKNPANEFLGCCGLHHIDTRAIEIGIWLKESAHKKGYGMETVEALIKWTDEQLDYDYLFYPVDKRNLDSRRIPEKLGFTAITSYLKRKSDVETLDVIEYRKNKNEPS